MVTLVDPPRVQRPEIAPLTVAEAKILFGAAEHDRLGALYVQALTTGLRQGELLALCWTDVDLDERVLRVRRSLQVAPDGGWMVGDTKTQALCDPCC